MKCTNCDELFITIERDFGCPNECISISHDDNGEIYFYSMSIAKWLPKSYLLIADKDREETTLQCLDLGQIKKTRSIMPIIVRLDYFLAFDEHNQEEMDNLIPRLIKLQAFS